jgi:hypothetical protein
MLRHRLPFLFVAALAVGCSEATTEPKPDAVGFSRAASVGQPVHQVQIGGPDVCTGFGANPGCDANFTLTAQVYTDGSVSGYWIDRFSQNFGGGGAFVTVDCVAIDGNTAWIGGVVTKAGTPGTRAITVAQDRGTSFALEPDDGFATIYNPQDFGLSTNCQDKEFFGVLNVAEGQVTIR